MVKKGALGTNEHTSRNTALYIAKYNRFVDNILGRMNTILRKSYDPVSVRLQPVDAKKKSKKSKGKKKNNTKSSKTGKKSRIGGKRSKDISEVPVESNETIPSVVDEENVKKATTIALPQTTAAKISAQLSNATVIQTPSSSTSQISPSTPKVVISETTARTSPLSTQQTSPPTSQTANSSPADKNSANATSPRSVPKTSPKQESASAVSKPDDSPIVVLQFSQSTTAAAAQVSTATEVAPTTAAPAVATAAPASNQNRASTEKVSKKKDKKKSSKGKKTKRSKPRAKGTLYGLASLRRSKDVSVNIMADHTTVKTNFLIGPLILKVEKEFGRGAKKQLKSATATTAEMIGKMNLRIPNGKAARLHSIKVLQPKQVRVDSVDNHDRTREFIWRKSSDIAKVVSQKLKTVTRSMLKK